MRTQLTTGTILAGLLMVAPALAAQQGQQAGQQSQYQSGQQSQAGQGQRQAQRQKGADQSVMLKMSSESVSTIQQTLQDQGFYKGQIDGQWGPNTQQALRAFQEQQGFDGEGQLDFQTIVALNLDVPQLAEAEQQQQSGQSGQGQSQ
jgi:peptidoglycan hydrolase-like protein with peptidoglycan-binding domain